MPDLLIADLGIECFRARLEEGYQASLRRTLGQQTFVRLFPTKAQKTQRLLLFVTFVSLWATFPAAIYFAVQVSDTTMPPKGQLLVTTFS